MSNEKTQIRPLSVGDIEKAAEILDIVVSNISQDELEKIMSGDKKEAKDVAMSIFHVALSKCRGKVMELLASVNSMSVDEFKEMPASAMTDTIMALRKDERNADFLSQLRAIFAAR